MPMVIIQRPILPHLSDPSFAAVFSFVILLISTFFCFLAVLVDFDCQNGIDVPLVFI